MKIYTAGFKDNYVYSTEKNKKRTREKIGKRDGVDGELYAVMLSIGENYDKDDILRVIHRDKRVKTLAKGIWKPKTSFEQLYAEFVSSYMKDGINIHFNNIHLSNFVGLDKEYSEELASMARNYK
jgi:hypothetical protein